MEVAISIKHKRMLVDLLNTCKQNLPSVNVKLIEKAFQLSYESHKNDFRASGEPYFNHPYEVAMIVAREIPLDDISVISALLHDVVEDSGINPDFISHEFNKEVAEIEDTQKEIIFSLGATAEAKSKETGNHIKRVAEYSYILAKEYGLNDLDTELLKLASPMHDLGKIAIPDAILNKPGKLTPEEFDVIKTHTTIGYEILNVSDRKILKTAAIIAHEHHEKWNGKGYPRSLSAEDIHIYGRIIAIADVFDALGTDRCYKKAWEMDRINQLFKEESGQHFDPNLVDIYFNNINHFIDIKNTYKD